MSKASILAAVKQCGPLGSNERLENPLPLDDVKKRKIVAKIDAHKAAVTPAEKALERTEQRCELLEQQLQAVKEELKQEKKLVQKMRHEFRERMRKIRMHRDQYNKWFSFDEELDTLAKKNSA